MAGKITLSRKVTTTLSYYLVAIFIIMLGFSAFVINNRLHNEIDKKARFMMRYYVASLSKPMWDIDQHQIDKITKNIADEESIVKVLLRDESGKIIRQFGKLSNINGDGTGDDVRFVDTGELFYHAGQIFYEYKKKNILLGELQIYIDTTHVDKFLMSLAGKTLLIVLISVLVLILIIHKTISKSLRPVRILSSKINKMEEIRNMTLDETDDVSTQVKEVSELRSALVKMKGYYDEYQEELETQIVLRTKQLQDYQRHLENTLEMQNKDLADANNARSKFLTNMSHELRTPMHAIISYSQMGIEKIDTEDKEKLKKYYDNINQSGKRLLALLNNLLDLSKFESGKMKLEIEPVSVGEITDSVLAEIESLLRQNGLMIDKVMETEDLVCACDKDKIAQVVMNILSNAIKFSENGRLIRIRYREKPMTTAGGEDIMGLEVSVEDKGAGIAEGELENVFDKFVQGSKNRAGAGGTGLGLAICKEIIAAHKGRIWAQNNIDGGSIFTFIIPKKIHE